MIVYFHFKLKITLFKSLKNNYIVKLLVLAFTLILSSGYCQNDFSRFVDSADIYFGENAFKAKQFLDSIPEPIEYNLKGNLSKYYAVLALIHDDLNEHSKVSQYYILSLKYAEKEKNYLAAADACIYLFSVLNSIKKDSIANAYLDKAKYYYELSDYEYGVPEVEITRIYKKYSDEKYEECNLLIKKKLDSYRAITEYKYYHLYALYILINNNVSLKDFKEAFKYYHEFKTLKGDKTISSYNYHVFDVDIMVNMANTHFQEKNIDSAFYYKELAYKKQHYMSNSIKKAYYSLCSDLYNKIEKVDISKAYLDSLKLYQEKMFDNVLDSGYQINGNLLEAELELEETKKQKNYLGYFGLFLLGTLFILSAVYFVFYRKQKIKLEALNSQNKSLIHLKTNHEKLTVKVQGLEDYISGMKSKVKVISSVNDVDTQKEMIKEFYKNLHLGSSTILDESNNHFELVNDFNINFFNKLKELFPKLNDSEIIICYYIYIGFKNKEIALFLNTSIRAIESKRYRITKKINYNKQETTLVDFLRDIFIE